jgi:hypothetical protein
MLAPHMTMHSSHIVQKAACLVSIASLVVPAGSAHQIGGSSNLNTTECAVPHGTVFPLEGFPPVVSSAADSQFSALVPTCAGWSHDTPLVLVTVAGRFKATQDVAVLKNIGAISTYSGIQYWSVTEGRLETLITKAFAVDSPTTQVARADFRPSELVQGSEWFFLEQDNRLREPVLYRLRVIERNAGHVVVEFSNVSRVRRFLLTLFEAGDLRTVFFLDEADGRTWTCYAISGLRTRAFADLFINDKSQRNRLLALYGHITKSIIEDQSWAK